MKMKLVDVEDNLINGRFINVKTLQALAFIYEKSIIYKNENMFYDFQYGGAYTLFEFGNNGVEMHFNTDQEIVSTIREKLFCVDVIKPIRGISSYTVADIKSIANKLAIKINDNSNKSKTKKGLYQEIVQMLEKLR